MDRRKGARMVRFSRELGQLLGKYKDILDGAEGFGFRQLYYYGKQIAKNPLPPANGQKLSLREREVVRIKSNFAAAYKLVNRRTAFDIKVERFASAGKIGSNVVICLRWGWNRKVYLPVLLGRTPPQDKMILQLERIRINNRDISLYQGIIYNTGSHKQEDVYVATTYIETCKEIAVGKTVQSTITTMERLIASSVARKITNAEDQS